MVAALLIAVLSSVSMGACAQIAQARGNDVKTAVFLGFFLGPIGCLVASAID